jgi:hypothetical protein
LEAIQFAITGRSSASSEDSIIEDTFFPLPEFPDILDECFELYSTGLLIGGHRKIPYYIQGNSFPSPSPTLAIPASSALDDS